MEHYVILFDSFFLPQALALHCSLERKCQPYRLWILCVDRDAFAVLGKLALKNVELLPLEKLETEELRRIKSQRTRSEYCWTLKPLALKWVLNADSAVQRVTYVDSDIWFYSSPRIIFEEFENSGKHVLITEHAYATEYDQTKTSGKYCAQFVTFTRKGGALVRQWWEERCLEWCYARFEDNKFADQKYLDDWPQRFPNEVHVLQNQQLALAPWNTSCFLNARPVFYHFQGLRLNQQTVFYSPEYYLPTAIIKAMYEPYVADLRSAVAALGSVGWSIPDQVKWGGIPRRLIVAAKEIKRTYEKLSTRQREHL